MIEGEGIIDGAAKEPSIKLVAEWMLEVYNNSQCKLQGMRG